MTGKEILSFYFQRSAMRFNAPLLILLAVVGMGCASRVSQNAGKARFKTIEDESWFKDGVDRFYLAYADQGNFIDSSPQRLGWEILMGVGCYGEPKNRDTLVDESTSSEESTENQQKPLESQSPLSQMGAKRLIDRELITDFPLAKDPSKPKKGECVVLLGSESEQAQFIKSMDEDTVKAMMMKLGGASAACWGLATSGLMLAFLAGATATTSGGAAAVIAAAAPSAITFLTIGSATTSAWYCGTGVHSTFESLANYQKDENKKLFFKTFARAEELAKAKMKSTPTSNADISHLDFYIALEKEGKTKRDPAKLRHAVAVLNPFIVRAFNQDIVEKMEQGWFKETKFFDAIKSIKTEVLEDSGPIKEE